MRISALRGRRAIQVDLNSKDQSAVKVTRPIRYELLYEFSSNFHRSVVDIGPPRPLDRFIVCHNGRRITPVGFFLLRGLIYIVMIELDYALTCGLKAVR